MAAPRSSENKEGKSKDVLISNVIDAQRVRKVLEENKIFDNGRRLKKTSKGRIAIPLKKSANLETIVDTLSKIGIIVEKECLKLPLSKTALAQTPYDCLVSSLHDFLGNDDVNFSTLVKDIPTHWERHGDLIVFSGSFFTHNIWQGLGPGLWKAVATSLGCSRLAQKGVISSNGYRSPTVVLLLGDCGWVQHIDNGIRYTYDLTKCMFSAGNITEKLRVAGFYCQGETVVDLYAGIGYFTLPYLVHAKASHVHACEWNPDAVDALRKTLALNSVSDRCTIHQGDNRETCPRNIADRVNLGLIPSSEEGWPVACRALRSTGGYLHIHSNVTSKHSSNPDCSVNLDNNTDKSDSPICLKCGNAIHVNFKHSSDIGKGNNNLQGNHEEQQRYQCYDRVNTDDLTNSNCDASKDKDALETELSTEEPVVMAVRDENSYSNSYIYDNDSLSRSLCDIDNLSREKTRSDHETLEETKASGRRATYRSHTSVEITCTCTNKTSKSSASKISRKDWNLWAEGVAKTISQLCTQVHKDNNQWTARIDHIEHVKSYAPHIDHLVLDLECRPVISMEN
ncbi:tRNA wybutosine-synthesizing protein 2 homolog [Mizuhopecten yessoensis]|uniref:tRNA wybutosine-synthesizing protein 2 homolog n=1 Tax=Mizuhopecten yessoensis TaxID=6573 RepID=A0A210QZK1_MIZYE|nr:tRNA wybutosine-synthesizing protein 2 homolog [Mizuhopecten yessoensis]OWF54180.1 tRNA wybutosine-synthesizing protein 2-like [Mizuhopecten yessoensis]